MLALLVLRPETYLDAVSEGLGIFLASVFPGLFPFFVLTGLLTALGAGNLLSRAFAKPASRLFGAPPLGGYILAMSMLSGYPVGAKLVADFYKDGIIDEYDARAITAFASTTGPLFVLGTIGVKMLGDYKSGVIILLTHFMAAILNGIVFRAVSKKRESRLCIPRATGLDGKIFNAVLESSVASVLRVGACIIVFNMVIVALTESGVISVAGRTFEALGVAEGLGEGFASGLVEVTKGVYVIANSGVALRAAVPLVSLLVSFGGLSVTLQSMTFLNTAGVPLCYFLVVKISHAILAFALATVCALIFL